MPHPPGIDGPTVSLCRTVSFFVDVAAGSNQCSRVVVVERHSIETTVPFCITTTPESVAVLDFSDDTAQTCWANPGARNVNARPIEAYSATTVPATARQT